MLSTGTLLGRKLAPSPTKRSMIVNATIQANISVVDVDSLLAKFGGAVTNGNTRLLALTDNTDRTNPFAAPSIHCIFEVYNLSTDNAWQMTLNSISALPLNTGDLPFVEIKPWLN